MNKLISVLTKVLVVLSIYTAGFYTCLFLQPPDPVVTNEHAVVKAVCDYGHGVDSGYAEEACGKALQASGTIYLCNYGGSKCWVEENYTR